MKVPWGIAWAHRKADEALDESRRLIRQKVAGVAAPVFDVDADAALNVRIERLHAAAVRLVRFSADAFMARVSAFHMRHLSRN